MIDFSNFYQLAVKNPLSYWLEILLTQVTVWQCEALHDKLREWECAAGLLPKLTP